MKIFVPIGTAVWPYPGDHAFNGISDLTKTLPKMITKRNWESASAIPSHKTGTSRAPCDFWYFPLTNKQYPGFLVRKRDCREI